MSLPGLLIPADSALVTDEMRAEALAKAEDTIAKLDAIRKRRELPVEQLPLLANLYGSALIALADKERTKRDRVRRKKYRDWMAKQPQPSSLGFLPSAVPEDFDDEDE